jgi:hypothetical protein
VGVLHASTKAAICLCFSVSMYRPNLLGTGTMTFPHVSYLFVERSLELRRVIGRKSSPRNEHKVLGAKIRSSKREVSPKVGWHIETKVCWAHPKGCWPQPDLIALRKHLRHRAPPRNPVEGLPVERDSARDGLQTGRGSAEKLTPSRWSQPVAKTHSRCDIQ